VFCCTDGVDALNALDVGGRDGAPNVLLLCCDCGFEKGFVPLAKAENGAVVLLDVPEAGRPEGAANGFDFCPSAEGWPKAPAVTSCEGAPNVCGFVPNGFGLCPRADGCPKAPSGVTVAGTPKDELEGR
jgi:hypothetical protein